MDIRERFYQKLEEATLGGSKYMGKQNPNNAKSKKSVKLVKKKMNRYYDAQTGEYNDWINSEHGSKKQTDAARKHDRHGNAIEAGMRILMAKKNKKLDEGTVQKRKKEVAKRETKPYTLKKGTYMTGPGSYDDKDETKISHGKARKLTKKIKSSGDRSAKWNEFWSKGTVSEEQLDELRKPKDPDKGRKFISGGARAAEDAAAKVYYGKYDDEKKKRGKFFKDKTPESKKEAENAKDEREHAAKRVIRLQKIKEENTLDEASMKRMKRELSVAGQREADARDGFGDDDSDRKANRNAKSISAKYGERGMNAVERRASYRLYGKREKK